MKTCKTCDLLLPVVRQKRHTLYTCPFYEVILLPTQEACRFHKKKPKKEKPMEPYIDLGWMNLWTGNGPTEYQQCREQGHKLEMKRLPSCVKEYTCHECGIYWRVDSGD
jgi:hypothetical protein